MHLDRLRRATAADLSGLRATLAAVALAGSMVFAPSLAGAQPAADRMVTNCTLSLSALNFINQALSGAGIASPRVDFIVVYTIANPNDGQALGDGAFTGPVLCGRPATTTFPALPAVTISPVAQTTNIPPGPGTVDLLDIETALITQYRTPSGETGDVQKRFCHSVADNNDCFTISD